MQENTILRLRDYLITMNVMSNGILYAGETTNFISAFVITLLLV